MNNKEKEMPMVVFQKRTDIANKMIIPKFFVEANGRDFLMKVYKGKLVIEPIKKEEE